MFSKLSTLFIALSSINCFAITDEQLAKGVISKESLVEQIAHSKHYSVHQFIKNLPIYAYKLTTGVESEIPEVILKNIGKIDNTQYSSDYFKKNIGSAVALQLRGSEFDFYVIDKDKFNNLYRQVSIPDVMEKNIKLTNFLLHSKIGYIFSENNANLVGIIKLDPVNMIKMSEVGFSIKDEITIESPWEEQTKPAGIDAYLVYESDKKAYYMVNVEENGLPIGYIPNK
ncbi:hypothetical protein QEJ31_00315 [Pigmentibacter sp. JX0631]|uniref:hypothetical protein n=1 Tax=Pigmentibacter sp. JX0631 TaxID=2976982 RepID=UPI0024689B15|nr:hypothetical protein [Pigmentibacter sp. JX0631]WGL60046.1 hypothetical protein QEJ31_00315 [Pigmentibacter sp. JX0631]